MRSYLSEKREISFFPVVVSLLNVWIETLNHIIQQLSTDVMAPCTGTLQAREFIPAQEDLKGAKSFG